MMDQKKLDLVNQLLDERDQRRTLENNSIVKLLSGIIDMTATEKLTDDVSALTDKLMEVSLQAPQLHGEALESIKNISSEMENMEFRAAQYATQLNDALKSQMSENNQSNVKLIESLKAQNTAIRKQIAETNGKLSSIQLRHGKTPVKGVDYTDGKDGEDGIGISSIKITDGSLLVTLTDGTEKNAGKLPTSKNGGKYARSPYEYAQEAGYTGTEDAFYALLANIGSSGGSTTGSGIIDFGAAPGGNTAEVTVLDANAKTASTISVFLSGTTTDHNEVEHLVSDIKLIAAPSDSSFSVSAFSSLRLTGTFKFAYTIA